MAGYGISCFVPNTRDVYHSESITQGLLLEVAESSVWNVLEGSITERLEQGLVIHSNSQVTAAKDKESGFVKGIGNGLPLNWGVAGFSCMCDLDLSNMRMPSSISSMISDLDSSNWLFRLSETKGAPGFSNWRKGSMRSVAAKAYDA